MGLGKILKKVAGVALPIVGNMIAPGIGGVIGGALGGAVSGGGVEGALMGGLGGLGGGALGSMMGGGGALSSLLGGTMLSGMGGFGGNSGAVRGMQGQNSMMGGSGSDPFISQLPKNTPMLNGLPWLGKNQDTNLIDTGNGNFLQDLAGRGGGSAIKDIGALLSIYGAMNPVAPRGTVTQEAIQNQIAAQKAQDDKLNESVTSALQAPGLARQQTAPAIDYYHYGSRPEAQFFDNVKPEQATVKMKAGGLAMGQADKIPAKLSEGEFVIPADVVSHLGDGNTKGGALQLSAMVKQVRKKKGAKPGLPKPSKSPLSYVGA